MFSLFFWVVNFVTMCFSHAFIVLLLLSSILSSRGFTLLLSIFFSHGLTVFFLSILFILMVSVSSSWLPILFFSWFGCLLVVNFVFSWCWVFCFCQFSFLMVLGELFSSNFVVSLRKLWKHRGFNFLCFQPVSTLVLHVVCNRLIPVCCRLSYKNSRALKKSELLLCRVCKCPKMTTAAERQNEKEWNWCKSNSWDLWDGRQISTAAMQTNLSTPWCLHCSPPITVLHTVLTACIAALFPSPLSTQCASPLQLPLKLWPFDTTTSHATKLCFQRSWTELGKTLSLTSSQQQAPLMMVHDPTRP